MSTSSSIFGSDVSRLLTRLLLPLMAAIALIAVLDASLKAHGLQPRLNNWGKTYDDYDVIYTRAVQAKMSGKRIVAFIGDSRVEWGLDPDVIQDVLDRHGIRDVEVFNLALPGRNVRTMLTRLNEVGFYPDILVVGYSHLSFYWSKNYADAQPHRLVWWRSDLTRVRSFIQRKILLFPFQPIEVWRVLFEGAKVTSLGSWLDRIDVSHRGQARVHYRISEEAAIAFQKKFYQDMYNVVMTDEMIAATNASFLNDMTIQREHGTKVILLKMPLSSWALDLERANERTSLPTLAGYLKTPYLDGNEVAGASALESFDGLHLTPRAAAVFARSIGESFILPQLN